MATNDTAKLWDSYYKGLKLYEQSQTHTFHYVDHLEKAELGVQTYPSIYPIFERKF